MLPRAYRLTLERDFTRVFKHGRALSQGTLSFRSSYNNLPVTRVGIVIANSVLKKATARNRAKRLIRAVFIPHYKTLRPGYDVVITGRKGIEQETFSSLRTIIPTALQKMGII